jgi:uncharacterized Ntn-hydrolase superfamily protein
MCPYLQAGVGAVSTQSWVNPYLAVEVLLLLEEGLSAQVALDQVMSKDPGASLRQIGVIGVAGSGVAWSGLSCTAWAGQLLGSDFAIQGNMLVGEETLDAMRQAWSDSSTHDLSERLMSALEAGDLAGGDKRGKQSAALKVVGEEAYALVDLRVDDHAEPMEELRRILEIAKVQLFPFVDGMPSRLGVSRTLPDKVTQMLLLSPADRFDVR